MNKTVQLFIMPQQFPCGPQSSCCGPIGQGEEEVAALKEKIFEKLALAVEVLDVTSGRDMKNHLEILRLYRSLGPAALPIVALDGEVVSLGSGDPEEVVAAVKEASFATEEV